MIPKSQAGERQPIVYVFQKIHIIINTIVARQAIERKAPHTTNRIKCDFWELYVGWLENLALTTVLLTAP